MLIFKPENLRNETEVESKFIVQYLFEGRQAGRHVRIALLEAAFTDKHFGTTASVRRAKICSTDRIIFFQFEKISLPVAFKL